MDGSSGSNRARTAARQIRADDDIDAIKAWLPLFIDKQTTFDDDRNKAERLLLSPRLQLGKPLSSLTHENWLTYQMFLKDPKPVSRWFAADGRKYSRIQAVWWPSAGPLSASSGRAGEQSRHRNRRGNQRPPLMNRRGAATLTA